MARLSAERKTIPTLRTWSG